MTTGRLPEETARRVDALRQDFFAAFFAGAFFAVFLAGAFFATDFLAGAFLAADFLAGAFFAADFLAGAFLAVFLAGAFFAVVFFAVDFLAGAAFLAVFLAGLFLAVVFFAVDFFAVVFFADDRAAAAALLAGALALFAAGVAAATVSLGSFLAPETTFLSSAPAVNFGTDFFFALIRAPVWGLRTIRASRTRFSKEPKPVIATFSPLATSRVIVSNTDSSAWAAALRFPSKRAASASMS